jgi:predicted metalloprotease with PDZ domain
MQTRIARALALALMAATTPFSPGVSAQPVAPSRPVAVPVPRDVPDARDVPYPGVLAIDIDATDTARGLFRVTETIPVAPGTTRLTLLLPQWQPGHHGPRGPVAELVGLTFTTAAGTPVPWRRDPVESHAFHLDLPAGTSEVTARYIHTSPLQPGEGRVTMSPEIVNLQWIQMSLYPAGHYVRQIRIRPSATLPAGWTVFTALDGAQEGPTPSGAAPASTPAGKRVTWAETSFETLADSPIFAGVNAARHDLGNGMHLDVVADDPRHLALRPEQLAAYRALSAEAIALYGARHYDHYETLVALTDKIGDIGLEHQRSSENTMNPTTFIEWDAQAWNRNVVAHEIAHSWNGKFRRPAGLWTPDYRTPMQDELLWVYEGQNQFWGYVLAARSGIQPKDMVLGMIAAAAANLSAMPGREWRPVADTTSDPIFAARKPKPYPSMARGEDYYTEGALVWLEADQIIREASKGRRGLDDFARLFFGLTDGDLGQVTYTFDDVVAALGTVQPYDWAQFLRTRLYQPGQPAPLAGIEKAGYRLAWRDEPNPFDRGRFAETRTLSLTFSLGLTLDKDGRVTASQWNGPAFRAGIVTGAKITGVNGAAYTPEALRAAITAARDNPAPIQLLVQRGDKFQTVPIEWRGGLRYPWLERRPAIGQAGLDLLLSPRRP